MVSPQIASSIVQGLSFGSVYALIAMSMNISFRPTGVLNFAQGNFVMLGTLIPAVILGAHALPWIVPVIIAIAAVVALAAVEVPIAVLPVIRRQASSIVWLITTLAFSIILDNVAGRLWSDTPRFVKPPKPFSITPHDIGGFHVSSWQLLVIGLTIVLAIVLHLIYRLHLGKAMIALSDDRAAAILRGINADGIVIVAMCLGAGLAALAGALLAPLQFASISLGFPLLLKGFAAMAIGGLGDNRGALIGGYVVGLAEAFLATFVASGYSTTGILLVALAVFMARPAGLFGSRLARVV